MKDEIILDCEDFLRKKKKEEILSELSDLDIDEPIVSISEQRPEKKSKKTEAEKIEEETNQDDWLATVANFKAEPIKRKRRAPHDLFSYYSDGKKKKKKKKNKDGLTDYNKEFGPEMDLIHELMVEQSKFTDSLQKKYDAMETTKSSARGIGKFTTDLIEAITSNRNLSLQLIKEQAALKAKAADLTMKERKEFGKANENTEDIGLYSSSLLKKMISDSSVSGPTEDIGVSESSMEELLANMSDELGVNEGDEEVDKYLKYEKAEVTIYACINESTDTQYFVAKDKEGNIIDDYPLPEMTTLTINRSTDVASDIYSRKYPIIWLG